MIQRAPTLVAVAGGRDGYTPWTFNDAVEFLSREDVRSRAIVHGYLVAMYGSVLERGGGRDLDLLALAGPGVRLAPELIFAQLAAASRVADVLVPGVVAGSTHGFVWVDDRGRLIDLSVVHG